jgi:hypothetical protein
LGRRGFGGPSLASLGTASLGGDPSLALGATKKVGSGRREKGGSGGTKRGTRGDNLQPVVPSVARHPQGKKGPLACARGDKKSRLGATKKRARGDEKGGLGATAGGLTQKHF